MNTLRLGRSSLATSRLAYGCWRIAGSGTPESRERGRRAVIAAFDAGYSLFDLADIYAGGQCEELFGEVLAQVSGMRSAIVIATKCGVRLAGDGGDRAPMRYDSSKEHIVRCCEQSLQRMGVEQIDLFQLHRPDFLMHPEEVAGAFSELSQSGKVREFGVSNFRPSQVIALQAACPMPLVSNQVEISLTYRAALSDGTLDQCLAETITPLAWSPLAGGLLGDGGTGLSSGQHTAETGAVHRELDAIAQSRGVSRPRVAVAWLLRHPAGIVPLIGSTDPDRIRELARAGDLELTREEWYRLLEAAAGDRLP